MYGIKYQEKGHKHANVRSSKQVVKTNQQSEKCAFTFYKHMFRMTGFRRKHAKMFDPVKHVLQFNKKSTMLYGIFFTWEMKRTELLQAGRSPATSFLTEGKPPCDYGSQENTQLTREAHLTPQAAAVVAGRRPPMEEQGGGIVGKDNRAALMLKVR